MQLFPPTKKGMWSFSAKGLRPYWAIELRRLPAETSRCSTVTRPDQDKLRARCANVGGAFHALRASCSLRTGTTFLSWSPLPPSSMRRVMRWGQLVSLETCEIVCACFTGSRFASFGDKVEAAVFAWRLF